MGTTVLKKIRLFIAGTCCILCVSTGSANAWAQASAVKSRIDTTVALPATAPPNLVGVQGVATGTPVPISGTAATVTATVTPAYVASATNVGTCVSVGATTTVLAALATRKFASIIAMSSNTARVRFRLGATAVATTDMPLAAGQSFTLDGTAIYTGVIDTIAESGTQTVCGAQY